MHLKQLRPSGLVSVQKPAFAVLVSLFFLNVAYAQNNDVPTGQGKLTIYQAVEVDTLLNRISDANTPKSTLKGFRIQIYSGSSRVDANKVRADFLDTYTGEKIYFDYKQPYYKVRIGDYRNKIEAQKLYQALLLDTRFSGVLIVPDEINFPELKTNNQPNE